MRKDEAVLRAISIEGKCLLGRAVDLYRIDGSLKKHYQAQVDRLGLMTIKAVSTNSYTIHVYAVRADYMPQALRVP